MRKAKEALEIPDSVPLSRLSLCLMDFPPLECKRGRMQVSVVNVAAVMTVEILLYMCLVLQ